MAKGKAQVNYLHSEGLVSSVDAPDWSFIYETSLVKDAKWNIGDRVVLPDGRVFRYAKSAGAINVDYACKFMEDECQGWTVLDATNGTHAVGDKEIVVNGGTHAALTKDELRGGYVIIFKDGGGGYTQFRGIIGNEVSVANADMTIQLDAPLDVATVGGTTACEVFYNPYASLDDAARTEAACTSFAGKPAVHVAAASTYFWVQTWGPCWIAPSTTDGTWAPASNLWKRAAYFRHDGTIEINIATGSQDGQNTDQLAGFLINEGYSAGPLLMLQVSP